MFPRISKKHENNRYPFWVIINPRQNFEVGVQGVHNIAGMITGIWFSREEATSFLKAKRHNFSKHAVVYCMSGCYSSDWEAFSKSNTEEQ